MACSKESSSTNISPSISRRRTADTRGRRRWLGSDGHPEWSSRTSSVPSSRHPPVGDPPVLGGRNRGEGAGRLAPAPQGSEHRRQCSPRNPKAGRAGIAAAKTGLSEIRNQIILEVTERGIADNLGIAALEAASRSGIPIALDDVTLSATNLVILSRCTLDVDQDGPVAR